MWHLGEHGKVELSARRDVKVLVPRQQWGRGRGKGTLPVQLGSQVVPIFQTNLEDLRLFHFGHQQHVEEGLAARQVQEVA